MGRPKGTGRHSDQEIIEALADGGTYKKGADILGENPDAVRKRAQRMGLVWVPVHEELRGEVTEITLRRQNEINET